MSYGETRAERAAENTNGDAIAPSDAGPQPPWAWTPEQEKAWRRRNAAELRRQKNDVWREPYFELLESLSPEARLPWGNHGLIATPFEFRKSKTKTSRRGRPKQTARLRPFHIATLELMRSIPDLDKAEFAAKAGILPPRYNRLTHHDRRRRAGVHDVRAPLLALGGYLVEGEYPTAINWSWMARWWTDHLPIEVELDERGKPQGGPRSGEELLERELAEWAIESPIQVATKPDWASILFDAASSDWAHRFAVAIRELAASWTHGRGKYWYDGSEEPRGGYRHHVDLPRLGHVAWGGKWPNMPFGHVDFFPESLSNGWAQWLMHSYVLPATNLASLKVGRRDTAFDYVTRRPGAPFFLAWSSTTPTWSCYAPNCPSLAPIALNVRIGSFESDQFHRAYDKTLERTDSVICGYDAACSCGTRRAERCVACSPGNFDFHVFRAETVEMPSGSGRHPAGYAFRAPNPCDNLHVIDIRDAVAEPYALFLLIGCRLYGVGRVRQMFQEVGPSHSRREGLRRNFDRMLRYYLQRTRLPQPADLYDQARPRWDALLHSLCNPSGAAIPTTPTPGVLAVA